jgi:hypothetical protein
VSSAFAATTAYTATVTLTAKAGYTFTGVESSAFSHGEVRGTGVAGSGVLILAFAQTGPGTGSLKVSIGFSYGDIEVRGSDGINRIYKGGDPSRLVLEVTGFEELTWYVDKSTAGITKNPLTLEAGTYSSGTHSVTFTGKRGGIPYSQPVAFTVEVEGGDNTWEWTQYTVEELSAYQTINSIAYGKGAGFIAGSGTDWNKPAIARSANGAGRWDVTELTDLAHYDSFVGKISRLDDKFLITRGSGVKYGLVSPDNGETWTEVSIGLGTKGHTYAADKGLFLVSGQHGQAAWSGDGMATFHVLTKETTTFDNGSASQLNAAAYGNGVFVLGGGRGHTAVSRDGKFRIGTDLRRPLGLHRLYALRQGKVYRAGRHGRGPVKVGLFHRWHPLDPGRRPGTGEQHRQPPHGLRRRLHRRGGQPGAGILLHRRHHLNPDRNRLRLDAHQGRSLRCGYQWHRHRPLRDRGGRRESGLLRHRGFR